jgi:hypothetical protein
MPQHLKMVFDNTQISRNRYVKTTYVKTPYVKTPYVKPKVNKHSNNFMGLMELVKSRGCSACGG